MGFSRPFGLLLRCVGSWPFTGAALRVLRCLRAAPADSMAFTIARSPPSLYRGLRGPHRSEDRLGSFLLNTTTPVVFPAASPVRLFHSAPPRVGSSQVSLAFSIRFCFAASLGLSKDRLSIGPPCRSPLPAPFDAFEAGVATALSRDPPSFRPRRFHDLAGFLLLQATGVLHPAPILGFAAFPAASAPASASFPAARFHPSKPCSPQLAAPLAHAWVAAVRHHLVVADAVFTEPLPSSSFNPVAFAMSAGNLEGFLVLRSRTPVRRFQRRSALAPLGLSIL